MNKEDLKGQMYGSTLELAKKVIEKGFYYLSIIPKLETVVFLFIFFAFVYFFLGALPALLEK